MDKNNDGVISEEEFLEGCEKVGIFRFGGKGWNNDEFFLRNTMYCGHKEKCCFQYSRRDCDDSCFFSWLSVSTFYLRCNTEWHRCGHHCISYLDIDTETKTKIFRISD